MAKKLASEKKQIYTTQIRKVGGSFGVILPKLCAEMGFLVVTDVTIVIKNRRIEIIPTEDVEVVSKERE